MSKSKESFSKKEKEKKRMQKKQMKETKKLERMANNDKGKTLDEMYAYVDEFGNLTSTPPQDRPNKELRVNRNLPAATGGNSHNEQKPRKGIVTFFNAAKGFGFIRDLQTNERIFMHFSSLTEQVEQDMEVTFEVQHSTRGLTAAKVKPVTGN
ncbi:cold shock domain-containing protein [Danxiaibacter flavus]|uniref:Cold shock domain-containing protein n=1 Tax=Danxiaibacter flavus TaxID=3049108 RepID=A0ABV3ZMW5_9BACT|nr:cold shock domain-containing protein [Chitinophagaceae bacterium DXS]